MVKHILDAIRNFFSKSSKQNSIQVDTIKNGNIYQDSNIKIENPAVAINHIKDSPDDLKITLDSISSVLLKQSEVLPQGYQAVVNMRNGKADIHSEPVNEEAKTRFPQHIKGQAKVQMPAGMSFQELLRRARISQVPINIEMIDMQKMIGDIIDPYQDQFQKEWRKSTFKIVPEELPVGMKAVIVIDGSPYQYDTIMRMQPVDPDANIVKISNVEYASDFVLELTYHMDTHVTDFTYKCIGKSWKSIHKFLNFMKVAVPKNVLRVHLTEVNQDLFYTELNCVVFAEDYDSIDYNIEVAKRLLMIENQFGLQFPTDQELSNEDIELIWFLSNSIMKISEGFTWENFSMTANLHLVSSESLDSDACLKFKEIASMTILGIKVENLNVWVELESARIANLTEVEAAINTNNTEQIQIMLMPGERGNHGTRIVEI